jgi:hypothetical protein
MKLRYAAFLPALLLAACGNETPVNENADSSLNDTATATVETIETNSSLPTPFRVAAMFKRSDLNYLPGITYNSDKASMYSTRFQLAQIMGVYSADMAYSVINKQTNEGQKYLKSVREVGNKLNLQKVFDQANLFDRFNANMDKEDSVGAIVAEIQYQTDLQLEENQQNELYGVIFAGAWIESMYIAGEVYKKEGNEHVVQALFEQMAVLKSIITELEAYKAQDPGIPGLITQLSALQAEFDGLPSVKKLNENPDLDFSDVKPEKGEMDPLIKKIAEIRASIIKG